MKFTPIQIRVIETFTKSKDFTKLKNIPKQFIRAAKLRMKDGREIDFDPHVINIMDVDMEKYESFLVDIDWEGFFKEAAIKLRHPD